MGGAVVGRGVGRGGGHGRAAVTTTVWTRLVEVLFEGLLLHQGEGRRRPAVGRVVGQVEALALANVALAHGLFNVVGCWRE